MVTILLKLINSYEVILSILKGEKHGHIHVDVYKLCQSSRSVLMKTTSRKGVIFANDLEAFPGH